MAELYVGFMNKFAKKYMGEHWKSFAPYFGTIGLYLGLANMIGLFGITPPTKDLNVTAALALMSCGLIYGSSFRYKGLKGGLHKFLEPTPLLLPINLMEVVIRPLSLCMRLFGNVLGAFIIMELIKLAIQWDCPWPPACTLMCSTASFKRWCLCSSPPCSLRKQWSDLFGKLRAFCPFFNTSCKNLRESKE